MKNLNQNDKNGKGFSVRKPTVSDLHEFPNVGIHLHIFNLALFLRNWGGEKVSPSEAVDLIKQKFYQCSQRRDLQPREVENAVEKAFNSTGISVRSSNKVFIPKQVMTSEESLWPKTLQRLATEGASDDAIRDALEQYRWPVSQVIEDSPIKGDPWTTLDILGKLYEPDDLICLGTFYVPRTRLLNQWQVEGFMGDLFCPNPMRTATGVNLSGKTSQRCRDNVGRRKFIVYECDDTSLDFNQKAVLIKCLQEKTGAKLRMIVHSGGKSLHAFFDASEDEELNWEFMSVAVRYGGDPDMYRPEQQSRLPNAFRLSKDNCAPLLDGNGNKIRQTCLYLDPR